MKKPNSDSDMSNFDGADIDDDQHVNDKIKERINDDSINTNDENNNSTMECHMEEIPKKIKLIIRQLQVNKKVSSRRIWYNF